MSPSIAPPPPDTLAVLLDQNAHRHPEKATVTVIGDGGASLVLPLLLGIPSGTNKDPAGAPPLPAWENLVAATMGARKATGVSAELVRDCLIYPTRGVLAGWEDRWPAIIDSLDGVVLEKIGAVESFLVEPRAGEKAPDAIASVVAASPTGTWRWITCGPERLPVVVVPPSKPHYDALKAALKRDGVECTALLDDLIGACVKGPGFAARVKQWPGIALPLEHLIVKMAGAAAEARLGEW
jgi:hypothetical protein